ncbi:MULTISPECIES: hypothetical protein [Fischerella]|nr:MULTISPECIES: hypothetical protein [Fischerella]
MDFRFCKKFDRRKPALKAFQDGFWIDPTDFVGACTITDKSVYC